jgi:protein transport protein SEC24
LIVFVDCRCSLVPGEYFSPTDHTGRRADLHERPELAKGCVEFIAPSEYMVRPPQPPSYFFVIDVSYNAITSGMFRTVVETIKATLSDFPGHPRTRIGVITYDSTVHFYNLKVRA